MDDATFTVTGLLWRHDGPAGWHFVTLPADVADEIGARFADDHRPFGSLAVEVRLGATRWRTSLFRDTRARSYLVPVKAAVRRAERLADGDHVTLQIAVAA